MAIKHRLCLDIPDTACENVIKIWDSSIYGEGLDVDCLRLDIYLPGFSIPIYYTSELTPGFTLNLSAVDLGLQEPDNEVVVTLPDGLYTIQYSVSPNEEVFVEYYHLRVTKLLNKYYREICKVQLEPCEPTPEILQKLKDLRLIKSYIDAAKAKAEYCHAPLQAVEMYSYADKLLQKYLTGCCISCK